METRPKDSSVGGGKTREEIVQDKGKEMLKNLPSDYTDIEREKTLPDWVDQIPNQILKKV